MSHNYQNTEVAPGRTVFIDTDKTLPSEVTFTASRRNSSAAGKAVVFDRGTVVLRSNATTTPCGADCPVEVTESVRIEFNVLDGAASLSALLTETLRLLNEAKDSYGFSRGLLPPVSATFTVA